MSWKKYLERSVQIKININCLNSTSASVPNFLSPLENTTGTEEGITMFDATSEPLLLSKICLNHTLPSGVKKCMLTHMYLEVDTSPRGRLKVAIYNYQVHSPGLWPDVCSGDLQAKKRLLSYMTTNVLSVTRCHSYKLMKAILLALLVFYST